MARKMGPADKRTGKNLLEFAAAVTKYFGVHVGIKICWGQYKWHEKIFGLYILKKNQIFGIYMGGM